MTTERCNYRIGDELSEQVQCARVENHQGTHRTRGGYIFSTEQSLRYERELELDSYISNLRDTLSRELLKASNALISASKALRELSSDEVYDVEFAEGDGHIEHAVREAGLFTAAAQAMTEVLLK